LDLRQTLERLVELGKAIPSDAAASASEAVCSEVESCRSLINIDIDCGANIESRYAVLRQGSRSGALWQLRAARRGADAVQSSPAGVNPQWGARAMWAPPTLRRIQREHEASLPRAGSIAQHVPSPVDIVEEAVGETAAPVKTVEDGAGEAATPANAVEDAAGDCLPDEASEELGEFWGAGGARWAWAMNGSTQNGWIRFCHSGTLDSKWGKGSWRHLAQQAVELTGWSPIGSSKAPVMLITFNSVEHALRLRSNRDDDAESLVFEMVARRYLGRGDLSLASQGADSSALCPGSPVCCPTIGWPQREEQKQKLSGPDGGEGVPAG